MCVDRWKNKGRMKEGRRKDARRGGENGGVSVLFFSRGKFKDLETFFRVSMEKKSVKRIPYNEAFSFLILSFFPFFFSLLPFLGGEKKRMRQKK